MVAAAKHDPAAARIWEADMKVEQKSRTGWLACTGIILFMIVIGWAPRTWLRKLIPDFDERLAGHV